MSTKHKPTTPTTPPAPDPDVLRIKEKPGQSSTAQMAELAMTGIASNAATSRQFAKGTFGQLGLTECLDFVTQQTTRVHAGNLQSLESTLTAQAMTLDSIFNELARRSGSNMGEYLDAADKYMRLALKAQSQCRATIETLAAIKNPPIVYAKQANIANGPQQVNNCAVPLSPRNTRAHAHVGEPGKLKNELLTSDPSSGLQAGAILGNEQCESRLG